MSIRFGIYACILLSILCWSIYDHYQQRMLAGLGTLDNGFPDHEACSLACGVSWDTYVNVSDSGHYDVNGWHAQVGDQINWRIVDDSNRSYRFDGLYFCGHGIEGLEMYLNGQLLAGVLGRESYVRNYRLLVDHYVEHGDVISVQITKTKNDGFVKSIQPTGVH